MLPGASLSTKLFMLEGRILHQLLKNVSLKCFKSSYIFTDRSSGAFEV
jgi:hypothetical protein